MVSQKLGGSAADFEAPDEIHCKKVSIRPSQANGLIIQIQMYPPLPHLTVLHEEPNFHLRNR